MLAAWLNYAKGAIVWGDLVDTNQDGRGGMAFGALIGQVEAVLKNPNASESELERGASLARAANLHDGHSRDCDTGTGTGSSTGTGTHTATTGQRSDETTTRAERAGS